MTVIEFGNFLACFFLTGSLWAFLMAKVVKTWPMVYADVLSLLFFSSTAGMLTYKWLFL